MTTAQVAEALGLSVRTTHRWIRQGRIPVALKLPGKTGALLFRRSDVEALIGEAA